MCCQSIVKYAGKLAMAVALAALANSAQADLITAGTTGATAGGSVNSITFTNNGAADVGGRDAFGTAPVGLGNSVDKVVNLDISALKLATPFSTVFTVKNTTAGFSEYLFHITLHNTLTHPFAIQGLSLSLVSSSASALFSTAYNAVGAGNSTDGINGNSGVFAWDNTNGANPSITTLQYGGLNGGGGTLAPGGTTTVDAFIYVSRGGGAGTTGTFTLNVPANPEPGTLLLAGLAIGGLAFYMIRRRQQVPGMVA